MIVAILENNQNAVSSSEIPIVLQKYLGVLKKLKYVN